MKQTRGFTLIELLVVIAIIGILSSALLSSVNVARNNANDAKRRADITQYIRAINNHYTTTGQLPLASGDCRRISDTTGGFSTNFAAALAPTYIPKISFDPIRPNVTGDYFYANQNDAGGRYTLCAVLEKDPNTTEPDFSGCGGWTAAYNHCVSQ